MLKPSGVLWIAEHTSDLIILRDREKAAEYEKLGWIVEGPYVPGRESNPLSPGAIRQKLNT